MKVSIFKKVLLCSLLFLPFVSNQLFAQNPRFKSLSVEHGLSQNTVYSIVQDDSGFMWFGTGDGLNRYDGNEFLVYKHSPRNINSINGNSIRALCQDANGVMWIGTSNGGLNRFDQHTNTFTQFTYSRDDSTSISNNFVRYIFEDSKNRLWIGTYNGLNLFDRASGTFQRFLNNPQDNSSLSNNYIMFIFEDMNGNIWIGTDFGLNRLNPDNKTFNRYYISSDKGDPLLSNLFASMLQKSEHELWIGTGKGLIEFDMRSAEFGEYLFDILDFQNAENYLGIRKIIQSEDGQLWLATERHGLFLFNPENKEYIQYYEDSSNPKSLSDYKILTLFEDRSGAFWIGTVEGGVNKIIKSYKKFKHYYSGKPSVYPLNDNMIMSIQEDRDGILWIGTWNGGLNRIDRQTGTVSYFTSEPTDPRTLASNDVRDILEDTEGNLWVGNEGGGLHLMNRKNGTFKRYQADTDDSTALQDNDVWHIYQDRQERLWLGTYGGGLSLYNPDTDDFTTFFPNERENSNMESRIVKAIYEDSRGLFWLGTENGLYLMDRENDTFVNYSFDINDPASINSNSIISIMEDHFGNMWFGTDGGGLNKLDAQQFKQSDAYRFRFFTEEDGLPNNVVYGLIEDEGGHIWVSTNSGLARFDPIREVFRKFDVTDGIQTFEFNIGAYYKSKDGELFFGGINGLNAFYPKDIKTNDYIPPVVMTSFRKYNREVKISSKYTDLEEITLNHDDDVVTFGFAALSYIAPEKNNYAYKLSGFNQNWINLGNKNEVMFTDLSAGHYTLQVRASNNDGVWNNQGLKLDIHVKSPYWRTWWFISVLICAGIFSIAGFYRYRTNTIRKNNEELQSEINERVKVEKALSKSERNYREIFNASSDAIIIHDANSGRILEVNQTMLDLYGYKISETLDLNIEDLSSGNETFKKSDAEKWIKKANEKGKQLFEWQAKKKNGELFWVEVALKRTEIHGENRVLAVVRDINERKQAEFELIKARNYINNIINSMPSIVVGVNEHCRITHWNEEAERCTGINRETATDKNLEDVIPHLRREIENIKRAIFSRQIIKENKIRGITGNETGYSDLTVYPLVSHGVKGAVIRVDDVTERVRLEEMMMQSEKMLSVGGLAAGMAHEINNPIAGMMQNAQVIFNRLTQKMKTNDEVAKECNTTFEAIQSFMEKRKIIEMVEAINITGRRASKIVENMLSFSRKGESVVSLQDITQILDDTIELAASDYDLKKKYDFRQITIEREYEPDLPEVHCERNNIQQVFLNVLRNGAQAMAGEYVSDESLNPKEPCFVIRVKRDNAMVRIEIEDNGPGMDEEIRRRAFEPFFTTKEVNVGTGLGLSVSYFIINEQHNGKMFIESKKGKGTKVIILLN